MAWDVDATRGVGCPSSAAQWLDLLASAGVDRAAPSHLYLCQESSGNALDAIGGVPFVVRDAPSFQTAISGWTRKALTTRASAPTGRFDMTAGTGWSVAATSVMVLAYVRLDALDAGSQSILSASYADTAYLTASAFSDGHLRLFAPGAGNPSADGAANYKGGSVFPLIIQYDRVELGGSIDLDGDLSAGTSAHGRSRLFTATEKVAATHLATASNGYAQLGADYGGNAAVCQWLYVAVWEDVAAEFSESESHDMLAALNWSPSWSPS